MTFLRRMGLAAIPAVLCACASTPRTDTAPPINWANASWQSTAPAISAADASSWHPARPGDHLPKERWWDIYQDSVLSQLEDEALRANASVQMAAARVQQARATAGIASASTAPRIDAGLRNTRTQTSANRPANTAQASASASLQNDTILNGTVSYELDLFGRLRLAEQAAAQQAEQAAAELINVQLLLSTDLASLYFQIRSIESEQLVLARSLAAQQRAAELLQARHDGGLTAGLDVAQQQALIDTTQTQITLLNKQSTQLRHALATLVGRPANQFTLPTASAPAVPPSIPVALPSEVLQRRPDIAAAARSVAAANLQLGVAERAWFPSLTLSGSAGWESKHLSSLLDAPSLIWALGASVTQAVVDGGRIQAGRDQARATRDLAAASYRATVLRAIQEVEDGLSNLNELEIARRQAQAAIRSAQRVLNIAEARYEGGLVTYLDIVTAQQNVLNSQRLLAQLDGQHRQASTYLVKAIGGGWSPDTVAAY
ncbi:MAG: efflux transporter outer membrane subunit [Aquabacterium sp.]|uniref:efflux transporter outer membrane subunit n=1 Tax=Aquabacterium sp. TaxID=1872578 RepID=UPI003BE3AEC1